MIFVVVCLLHLCSVHLSFFQCCGPCRLILNKCMYLRVYLCMCVCRYMQQRKQKLDNDSQSSEITAKGSSKKPPQLPPPVPASTETSSASPSQPITPSTTSENLSRISSPGPSPRTLEPPRQQDAPAPMTSLVFPSGPSRYAGMRVGRSAWTSAYLPPPSPHSGLEHGAAVLERLDACT